MSWSKEKEAITLAKWRAANPEKLKAHHRRYYLNNREQIKRRVAEYRKANKDKVKKWKKSLHERHPERCAIYRKRYAERHPDKAKESCLNWRAKNPGVDNARAKRWRLKNPVRASENGREYRKNHPEKCLLIKRDWRRRNKDRVCSYAQKRRSMKLNQFHPMADKANILGLMRAALVLTQNTGTRHSIDHIIPLKRGGFHHELNLQVMPFGLNSSKLDNPFWERPGFKSWRDVPEFLWPANLVPKYRELLAQKMAS